MSVSTLASRLQFLGGSQNERIKMQKLRSLQWALKNDYHTRMIKTPLHSAWPALINDDNLKPDYDRKIVSVEYNAGLEPGDVFECLDDGSHWMIYLPRLTETAYLRADIVRCRYTLTIDDNTYWIYFQGPTETDLRWFIKRGININELNLSGTIYIKLNKQTRDFFERFTHIKVDNHIWEVQVTDSISVPGVLELEVQEYYDNPIAELPEIVNETENNIILGENIVKQDTIVGYTVSKEHYKKTNKWKVAGNERVRMVDDNLEDGRMCKVRIYPGAIGKYIISYGEESLEVTIDWEQPYIKGETQVYPYEFFTYRGRGVYSLDTNLARIVSQDGKKCEIEILTGKKGQFTLYCDTEEGTREELLITIGSWFGGKDESAIGVVG